MDRATVLSPNNSLPRKQLLEIQYIGLWKNRFQLASSKKQIIDTLETYRDLFDNAHDLIHIVEPEGQIIYVNKAWEKLLGYPQEDIEGKSIYSFIHESDRASFIDYRNNILQGIVVNPGAIVRMTARNGRIIYLEGAISSRIVDGKALYTRGIFRDVTERLENESGLASMHLQLKERESNLHRLLFHAPDAIIVVDSASRIIYWNPKAEVIFGWKGEEVSGKSLTDFIIPQQYRKAHEEGMKRYLATGQENVLNRTVEITALNRNGKEFYVALTISSTSQNGSPAFIAFIRDIDEQKKNAAELEQKKLQLELSNQQLEQFAHVASHDMKEPIRKILLFIDRLKTDRANGLSDQSRNYLDRMEKSASRLSDMVEGVLAQSSLSGENSKVESVSLEEVIANVVADLDLSIQQKLATISYGQLPTIEGVPFLMYQLFYNLINNSLKFTRADVKPVIAITVSEMDSGWLQEYGLNAANVHYEICLSDNGIGFRQANAELIFKTFSRLHSKDEFEGTGLGLSLCKAIVEKHHGVIMAHGQENAGATFRIILPKFQV